MKNNSIKLMTVGKHQKGKTTLLEHLSRVGGFEDLGMQQPNEGPNAKTVGIKIGIWRYCKLRGNPTNAHPNIEFYCWDYAGEVCMTVYTHAQTHTITTHILHVTCIDIYHMPSLVCFVLCICIQLAFFQ